MRQTDVCVATIEKANAIVNRLACEGRLHELGAVVIDEIHLVGDQNRGYLLELLLAKLLGASQSLEEQAQEEPPLDSTTATIEEKLAPQSSRAIQLIGMSATLSRPADLGVWLRAAVFASDFRPVPLVESIAHGGKLYSTALQPLRTLPPALPEVAARDPDGVTQLCADVCAEGHSALLFCATKKWCESAAAMLTETLPLALRSHSVNDEVMAARQQVLTELQHTPAGLCPILKRSIVSGVAYHHAGA